MTGEDAMTYLAVYLIRSRLWASSAERRAGHCGTAILSLTENSIWRQTPIGRRALRLFELSRRPIRFRRDEPYRVGVLSGFGGSSGVMGTAEPVFETRLAEQRVIARNKCALVYLCAEVLRVRVSENLARIVACAEGLSDEFIETVLLGPGHLNGTIQRRSSRHSADRTGNIFGRHGLNEHRRHSNR